LKLSHSAKEKFLACPEKWRLYYKEKLRTTKMNSALFFGRAIDEALNCLLLEKKDNLSDEEKKLVGKHKEVYEKEMSIVEHNREKVMLAMNKNCLYFKSDFDTSLLDLDDIKKITELSEKLNYPGIFNVESFLLYCQERIKNKKLLDDTEQVLYNFIGWNCLFRKGEILIDAYRTNILPQIERVYNIQDKVELPDDEDIFIGYIDFVASFIDEPGVKYVCDNKTSSKPYKKDSVRTSEQLAVYSEYKEINNCAFIILEKKLRKKSPRVRTSIIKDEINEEQKNKTFDSISEVYYNIKEENFYKNTDNCFQYGRPCEYYKLCYYGDKKDLVKLEDEKDDKKEKN